MSGDGELSDDPNIVVIPVEDSKSDGLKSTWPRNGADSRWVYSIRDDVGWRLGLAQMWVEKQMGAPEEGITYILEKLPEGYVLMDRPRGTDPKIRDSFLFGHPSGRYFQSRITFFLHFYWLMTDRAEPCECKLCGREQQPTGYRPRKRRTKAEIEADRARNADTNKGLARNKTPTMELPEDEEGPDYWKIYAMQLKEQGTLDVEINHKLNRDWMFSHDLLKDYFVRLPLQPAFVPRRGEVVLFTLILEGTLQFNPKTKAFEMRTEDGRWLGQPDWRAGVVTQPAEEESSYLDIIQETPKKLPLSNSGFRVETLPHPLEDNKAWSLQYRYVPLKCIKPFSACHRWLFPTPREKWHPSIEHAMVSMASYTIVHNTRFKGTWPNAEIDCKGLFIGSELFTIKDTVRLKPLGLTLEDLESKGNPGQESHDLGATVTDVMVIERIFSKLEDCDADPNSDQLARKHVPMLAGKVYTRDPNRLNRVMPFSAEPLERLTTQDIDEVFDQAGMRLYGRWYRVSAGKTCIVSPGLVLGRCYEPEASQLHFGHFGFDFDIHNILQMRRYSLLTDSRIPEICDWFWAESRAEALGIATSNGIEVGPAAEQRDNPLRWQAILRILDGSVSKIDYRLADLDISIKGEGRSRAKKKFSEVSKTSKLVSTGLGAATENEDNGIDNGEGPYNLRDDDSSSSESDVSESKLIASIPLREPSEGPEYLP